MGVFGVGSLGQWHAKIYARLPTVELVGVYDIRQARSQAVASKYRTRSYPDLAILAGDIEAASVVVPAGNHFEVAKQLFEHGVHLLVEKPIATTTQDAETMVALAQAKDLILQVGHVERFNPVMNYLEGILVKPRFIEAHRLSPYPAARSGEPARGTEVSVVLDLMIHDLEVILHMVRSPVREIHAVGIPVLSHTDDIANTRLAFENGCVANVTTSRISPEKMRKIRVFQEDAYISLDYQHQTGELYRRTPKGIERNRIPIEKGEPLLNELSSFAACVAAHGTPLVGGEQAANALQLAVDISRHIRDHSS